MQFFSLVLALVNWIALLHIDLPWKETQESINSCRPVKSTDLYLDFNLANKFCSIYFWVFSRIAIEKKKFKMRLTYAKNFGIRTTNVMSNCKHLWWLFYHLVLPQWRFLYKKGRKHLNRLVKKQIKRRRFPSLEELLYYASSAVRQI